MNKIKSIASITCLIIILANLLFHAVTQVQQNRQPLNGPGDGQGGIGLATVFIFSWAGTSILSTILFLIVIFFGIKYKELLKVSTLLTIGLITLTFFSPIILVEIF